MHIFFNGSICNIDHSEGQREYPREMEITCGSGVDLRKNHQSHTTVGRAYLLFPGDDKYEWFPKLLESIPNGREYLSTLKIYARLHPKALYLRYLSDTETDNRPSNSGQ